MLRGWICFVLFCVLSPRIQAVTLILPDFDGTEIAVDGNSTFGTYYRLYRNPKRVTVLQDIPAGPEEIYISTGDYEAYKNLIAREEDRPGYIGREVMLKDAVDPQNHLTRVPSFRPGDYLVRVPDTFIYFNAGKTNYLLEDFKRAIKKDPKGKTWKTPIDALVAKALSRPETALGVGKITARGHTEEEWREYYQFRIDRGDFKNHPNYELFRSVSLPEYDQFDTNFNIGKKKRFALEEIVQALRTLPIDEKPRLSPDGDEYIKSHYVIIAEDNQDYVEMFYRELEWRARNRQRGFEIKFALYNAGTDEEVARTGRPRFSIFKNSGLARAATPEEEAGEFLPLEKPNCAKAIANAKGRKKR